MRVTTRNRLPLPEPGQGIGTWGAVVTNNILRLIDEALDGVALIDGDVVRASDGASDDARRRVWWIVGDNRSIDCLPFKGVRIAVVEAEGGIMLRRANGDALSLGAGTHLIHMIDGKLDLLGVRRPVTVYTPTESPVRAGTVALLAARPQIDLPDADDGDELTVVAPPGGATVRGPIDTGPTHHILTINGETLSYSNQPLQCVAYAGRQNSMFIREGRSQRFVAAGGVWFAC